MAEQAAETEVGDFILKRKLGQGSSGFVWLAVDREDTPVVVKIVPLTGWRKFEYERETEACQILKHHNIIRLHSSFTWNKQGVLVLEKLDRDLLDFLDEYTINEMEARMMFTQILEGINFLHINCYAHMDVKPENILIRGSNVLKVADLGSAFKWEKEKGSMRTGKAGTSFYCAPEVKSGNPYLADKADIWSLGITLHVMLTGFWPYLGQTEKEVLSNAKKGKVDLADQHLSESLQDLLLLMLQLEPTSRPTIPEILRHPWFQTEATPEIAFTPRQLTTEESDAYITDDHESDEPATVTKKPPVLEELTLEGLKSPRHQLMVSPRQGIAEFEGIRPSPRAPLPGAKQTKFGKLLHSVRKGLVGKPKK